MNNIINDQITQTRTLLENAKSIVIATHINPSVDSIASTLSLYLSLSSVGKQISIVCPSQMTVEFSKLIGVDRISGNILAREGRNLIISFPYQEGSIEKVSYNIENDSFNLVIEPREGYPQINQESVKYSYSDGNIDLIITIDTPQLSDLDYIYQNNQQLFSNKPIINIDNHANNTRYGKLNLVDQNLSSTSEIIMTFLSSLGFKIDTDIATNLLAGLTSGSQNFTSEKVSASTFETAAICLRNGAKSINYVSTTAGGFPPSIRQPSNFRTQNITNQLPNLNRPLQGKLPQSSFQPITKTSYPDKNQFPKQDISSTSNDSSVKQSAKNAAPPDWLKPKIYKGSTIL